MRQTKKITISAMTVALGTVFLVLGAVFDVLDLSACAFASLLVAFVYVEVGSPYTYLVWLATALLTFVFFPGSLVWVEYLLVFGIYPVLKALIEKLPRVFWLLLKLVYFNVVIWLIILASELVFKIPFFSEGAWWLKAGLYLLLNVAFVAYDIFLTVLIRFYFQKIRPRFANLLK